MASLLDHQRLYSIELSTDPRSRLNKMLKSRRAGVIPHIVVSKGETADHVESNVRSRLASMLADPPVGDLIFSLPGHETGDPSRPKQLEFIMDLAKTSAVDILNLELELIQKGELVPIRRC